MRVYRYYSILRPVGIGTYPKKMGNKVRAIENFEDRQFVEEIGREAWGYIEYQHPLTEEEARNYDLIFSENELTKSVPHDTITLYPQSTQLNMEGDEAMPNTMTYSQYLNEYKRNNYKRLSLEMKKAYYEEVLAPAAREKGMPVNTFIKEAIAEKIEREKKER